MIGWSTIPARPPLIEYPNGAKLVALLAGQLLFLLLLFVGSIWLVITQPSTTEPTIEILVSKITGILLLIILVPFVGLACVSIGYRLVVRKPAVTVTDEGLIDGCSFLLGGVGLIRWEDMQAFGLTTHQSSPGPVQFKSSAWYVIILLRDEDAFFQRRSARVWWLHRLVTILMFSRRIFIPQFMLPWKAEQVWGEMRTRYEAYLQTDQA